MTLGALETQFWKEFCEAIGRPDWNQPNYFEPGPHQKVMIGDIAAIFKQKTQAEWISYFAARDCCGEPILNLDEVIDDPEVHARQMVVDLVHESWGAYRQLGIAPKFSLTPGIIRSHAPELGEHSDKILLELGYSQNQIEELRSKGVV